MIQNDHCCMLTNLAVCFMYTVYSCVTFLFCSDVTNSVCLIVLRTFDGPSHANVCCTNVGYAQIVLIQRHDITAPDILVNMGE